MTAVVQQPEPFDIVGSRVLVAGLVSAVEATMRVRVRDGNGLELASTFVERGGGLGEIEQFQAEIALPATPPTPNGFVEVFENDLGFPEGDAHGGGASEIEKVVVPVVFGSNLVAGYTGYTFRIVVDGDTLSTIAGDEYGDASRWTAIFEANRDQIGDPERIYRGQRLRIPRAPQVAMTDVAVYFLNTVRFADGTEPYVEAVSRRVPAATAAPAALDALFAGPTTSEQAADLTVERSKATGFTGLAIESGIARVTLVGGCDSGGSTFTVADLITPTLKQFATVDHVKIYDPDGRTAAPNGPSDSIPDCLNP